ncbi:hypothetical protein PPRY_a2915 [Pseudoalteromonas prydzensis ACAM 620]|nr:hypothetical protein [Pseudoalteromonas prydzensis ACAM 620]
MFENAFIHYYYLFIIISALLYKLYRVCQCGKLSQIIKSTVDLV